MIQYPRYRQHRFSSFQVIIAGFAAVDLVGALLLMLPIAAQQRCVTPFHEALFTSTSALCVTGLVVQDTGSYWSAFGQSVILLLIQIGGLGVITVGAAFALLSGRKISLKQRSTMQEATAAPQMGGIVRLTGFILRITALFELAGAALLLPTFCADYGLRGIWYALFHSISAFCNAGFDLLGTEGAKFVSLTRYAGDPLLTTVIAALIVFGGLGFLTWEDICTYRLDLHRYRMQSKVILVTTAFLLVLPTLYFYCFEFTAGSARQRILLSMFQSVTPRTAGFNTADLAAMGSTSQALMVVLMRNPNFLVLDEPTNDLDIITLNVLEEYLQNFKGCVIVVSHDRYFMDKVVDHLMVFNGQGDIRDFPGNYSDYRDWKDAKAQQEKEAEKPQEEKTARVRLNDKRKMSFKEKREFEQLEKEIAELETEKAQIEEQLCSGTLSVDELTEKSKRLPEVNDLIDEKTMRWLELSEIEG